MGQGCQCIRPPIWGHMWPGYALLMAEMPCMGDARVLHEGEPTIEVVHGAWAVAMNASDPEGSRAAWLSVT